MQKAIAHLSKTKELKSVMKQFPKPILKKGTNYFKALVRSIIYQQLSGKAAGTIEGRFLELYSKTELNSTEVLKLKDAHFKKVGISGQKMKYLRDLATKFLDGTVNPKNFHKMTDVEIREHLVEVKGIGVWTADMFLIFTLNRLDVMPTGDLAIKKGFKILFKLKSTPSEEKMLKLSKAWQPYRTVASLYLWKIADKAKEK